MRGSTKMTMRTTRIETRRMLTGVSSKNGIGRVISGACYAVCRFVVRFRSVCLVVQKRILVVTSWFIDGERRECALTAAAT
jgi:hypothetical protein